MKNKFLAKLFVVFAALALPLTACDLSGFMGGGRGNQESTTSQENSNTDSTNTNSSEQDEYTLSSIQVTKYPNKLTYFTGDTFDSTGMEVTAHFKPTKSEIVSNGDLSFNYDFSTIGNKAVTISYTYKSVTKNTQLSVTVKQRPPEGSVTLDFYAFNDWHGNILDTSLSIGISKTSTFLKQKTQNQNSLLISSGDMWQGTMESNSTRGKLMMEWMEYMNFTSMTIGNHEFDWGKEVIRQNAQNYNVPILGINIIDNNTHERADYVTPSTVVERGGVKIGIIGAIGNCYGSISYSQVMDVSFVLDTPSSHPLTDLIKAESTRLRQQEGCDFIVYSFHGDSLHDDTYYNLELSSGGYVDVVLEGHKHIETYYQDDAGIWHFQSNADGTMAINHFSVNLNPTTDEFTLSFNESTDAYRMNSSDKYNLATDAGVESLINKYDFSAAYQTIGYNSYDRSGYEMRQRCADLYLEYGFAKWGPTLSQDPVLAGGYISIRGDGYLRQGNITYANLYSLFPFDNDIVLCQITGSTLKTVYFNTTNSNYFMSYTSYGSSLKDNPSSVVANDLYYVICDTYSSDWMLKVGYNPIIVDRYSDEGCYARDLFADYAQKGGFNEGGQQINPWDEVPIVHSGTRTSPYTVSEAYALAKTSSVLESICVYIQGKISDLSRASIENGQYQHIDIIDIETGHQDLTLRVLALNRFCDATSEEGFKSINDLAVGDEILIFGKVEISGGTPFLTDDTVAVLVNDLPVAGLSQDDPISVVSYLLFDDGRSNLYVKGTAFNVRLDSSGNVTTLYLTGNPSSVIAQFSPYGYYVSLNNNVTVASGVDKTLIKEGSTIVVKILFDGVQIVDAQESASVVDGTYCTNSISYDSLLVGTTQTTVNAYNPLGQSQLITLTHSSMEIGIDREDSAYNNMCFKIQANGYMCITAPAGYKVTEIFLRICYTYDNFDFYAGNEINESNRLEETRQAASGSPWWLEYTVAADSNSVYIYNSYSGGVVNCYELRIAIQAI